MREVKFRVWDKCNKTMSTVGQINFISFAVWSADPNIRHIGNLGEHCSILLQYTGLKDKNGKEIYEGDIFRYEGFKGNFVVQWETFGWRLKGYIPEEDRMMGSFPPIRMPSNNFEYIEVIGNIYENPELLK